MGGFSEDQVSRTGLNKKEQEMARMKIDFGPALDEAENRAYDNLENSLSSVNESDVLVELKAINLRLDKIDSGEEQASDLVAEDLRRDKKILETVRKLVNSDSERRKQIIEKIAKTDLWFWVSNREKFRNLGDVPFFVATAAEKMAEARFQSDLDRQNKERERANADQIEEQRKRIQEMKVS